MNFPFHEVSGVPCIFLFFIFYFLFIYAAFVCLGLWRSVVRNDVCGLA